MSNLVIYCANKIFYHYTILIVFHWGDAIFGGPSKIFRISSGSIAEASTQSSVKFFKCSTIFVPLFQRERNNNSKQSAFQPWVENQIIIHRLPTVSGYQQNCTLWVFVYQFLFIGKIKPVSVLVQKCINFLLKIYKWLNQRPSWFKSIINL